MPRHNHLPANRSSPSTFSRLPAPTFKFLQEMPPRLVLCFEYTAHLYQSRRLDHSILEAAVNKFLAFDLIADSEVATVLFGQHLSRSEPFQRLDSSLNSRLALFSPAIDPYDEPVELFSPVELAQMDIQQQQSSSLSSHRLKLIKGTCSFGRLMVEINALMSRGHYDDVGADILLVTSGLFAEDEPKIEEIIRSSALKPDNNQIHLIIYPSTMLFDTKSRDGHLVLGALESDLIVRTRINKLLLIQRLTGAKIHLVKEHLDANGDVKVSTLLQFYQIFDHISKGHSWDQTQSVLMVEQRQQIDSRPLISPSTSTVNGSRLSFQFELDASIQNELFVGFLDPKWPQSPPRAGKRFALRQLQLRSPAGHLLFTETHTTAALNGSSQAELGENLEPAGPSELSQVAPGGATESAFFPYRAQLGLAAFHVKPAHLAHLAASNRLAGLWTLSAVSEEPIQTGGVALARVNPAGDTLTANCWVQTYHQLDEASAAGDLTTPGPSPNPLKAVKVFVQTRRGAQLELSARMEVQDEMGNIVQNVNMLDDGLGAPDMTRGDGILSQYVQRAHRPGFYKVTVELAGPEAGQRSKRKLHRQQQPEFAAGQSGQDNACCGSLMPSRQQQPEVGHLSRQLYCGTFHVDQQNKLAQQRPPRVSNLTVVSVDQEQRRVSIRWFEPMIDISVASGSPAPRLPNQLLDSDVDLLADESVVVPSGEPSKLVRPARKSALPREAADEEDLELEQRDFELAIERLAQQQQPQQQTVRGLVVATPPGKLAASEQSALSNRYEIKLFADRDVLKRAFDAKQEVGFKFTEWNVEGPFPNVSAYGGLKEVTLRVPYAREGIYYLAMKIYNNLGVASQLSNIVQFYIRNNLTLDEVESVYGQQATTVDAEGNVYDKNGDLISRLGPGAHLNYSLLRATSTIDGLSVLILFSLLAFLMSVLCISLLACLAGSARKSLASSKRDKAEDKKAVAKAGSVMTGAGSGSSMVSSSGCGSSQQSEVASSLGGGSQGGHDVEINKLSLGDELTYSKLHQQQQQQQQQAQLIQSQHLASSQQQVVASLYQGQQQQFYSSQQQDQQQQEQLGQVAGWPQLQHTVVNGFTYATIANNQLHQHHQLRQLEQLAEPEGDLNQNGLGDGSMSPVQSWPADILLSHYDKVKQARERNEAPPVMRIETLEQANGAFDDGLPVIQAAGGEALVDQSYLVRQPAGSRNQAGPSYLNRRLQQQLSSVLKSKRGQLECEQGSSPVLEGLTDAEAGAELAAEHHQQQLAYGRQHQQQLGPPPPVSLQLPVEGMPPPPQYIYCTPASAEQGRQEPASHLFQVQGQQQVAAGANLDQQCNYYANQWAALAEPSQTYGSAQFQAAACKRSEQHFGDKSNSAISEV